MHDHEEDWADGARMHETRLPHARELYNSTACQIESMSEEKSTVASTWCGDNAITSLMEVNNGERIRPVQRKRHSGADDRGEELLLLVNNSIECPSRM